MGAVGSSHPTHINTGTLGVIQQETPRTRIFILLAEIVDALRAGYLFRKTSNVGRPPGIEVRKTVIGYDKSGNHAETDQKITITIMHAIMF